MALKDIRVLKYAGFIARLALSVLFSHRLFDFLYSPVWMHGYIWSLNQQIEIDMADKSVEFILKHQHSIADWIERYIHAVLSTLAVIAVLWLADYHSRSHSVWQLLALSLTCGGASGLARVVQFRSRLLATIHDAFYVHFLFFCVSFIMTIGKCRNSHMPTDVVRHDTSANDAATVSEKKLN